MIDLYEQPKNFQKALRALQVMISWQTINIIWDIHDLTFLQYPQGKYHLRYCEITTKKI